MNGNEKDSLVAIWTYGALALTVDFLVLYGLWVWACRPLFDAVHLPYRYMWLVLIVGVVRRARAAEPHKADEDAAGAIVELLVRWTFVAGASFVFYQGYLNGWLFDAL